MLFGAISKRFDTIVEFTAFENIGGEFAENIETTEIKYFSLDEIPENLAEEKTNREQIEMCFKAVSDEN